ncbi:tRNA (adenosine(37)-N6)-threonylcarbamoyltransferase complex ATPase subunit type 1 TsaE [Xanthovirga aplysinae]|uniref:tRNA (adenosine(37)-N6)-threonylcarbamoyltransferase complex ATPase subunit type 1 TsaE n=1 Tax=Xanthovirga aplysinae TaxID=2529853 RepID=UPI0012BCEE98|nr:tRNA (adenosine(37)-N6)-threonylcarbamoyltransferase complex ATPase subunit type 1 TsaE [Xanthovirga aplysinae]MTI30962.1 tRNA (adenosine(37)-N6)-threonylcarbamoyltransferase complex ATPase subunit type 1 TsaE [Xanthovirga aplysinae]
MADKIIEKLEIICHDLEGLKQIAEKIISFAGTEKIWLLEGEMGAGKTTMVKAICDAFEVRDNVHSPTFSLVNEYSNEKEELFYHFDFYRIKDETEAMDIGCEEYFYSGNFCFIEWSSKIPSLIPEQYLWINIEAQENNSRKIHLVRYE